MGRLVQIQAHGLFVRLHPSLEAPVLASGLMATTLLPKILLWEGNWVTGIGAELPLGTQKATGELRMCQHLPSWGSPLLLPARGCGAVCVGGLFPKREGCCHGTVGAQTLLFAELPSVGLRLQLQPSGRAPQAAQLAQQGHPDSCSQSLGHTLLPAPALGRAGARRQVVQSPLRLSMCLPGGSSVPMVEGWYKYPVALLVFRGVSGRLENEKFHTWLHISGL